ncbi:MAG TPA: L-ribulose-5-phosphate 4-epimerase AraD [Polyangiaceae bacterium]|nr:L-ribulose-5-phosphate 4-epimerase AraD [Polyangiaceae bacterium]
MALLLAKLREQVVVANQALVRHGVVIFTFGNVSGISRADGLVAIKPSGVPYEELTPEQIVVTDLDGRVVDSNLRPSSDLATHLELYRRFPNIGGVAHTHSEYGTAWAQAGLPIPCLGTTHADYFHGEIPVTGFLTPEEIEAGYEKATGELIVRTFTNIDPDQNPGVLVRGHAPFAWGKSADDAVHNAVIIEYIARLAAHTVGLQQGVQPLPKSMHDKHFFRKHGVKAYYGQPDDL